MRLLRDAWLVALFDLAESLRSRKVMVLLALYVAGATAAAAGFVSVLGRMENTLAEQLGVSATRQAGAVTEALQKSKQLEDVIGGLIGDKAMAAELVHIPILALYYGWIALLFMPTLVMFTSCDTIASEVASGSCRFALVRTDRRAWLLGKMGGQASLLAVGLFGGALGTAVVGWGWLAGYAPALNAWWMLRLSGRAWISGFAYLGVALGISAAVRSPHAARALGLLALIALGITRAVLGVDEVIELAPVLIQTLSQLLPGTYTLDLWRPTLADRLPAYAMLLALGSGAFALGYARFARRDA